MTKPAKHYTATVFILTEDSSKVLLLHHRKFDKWLPPGGHQEPWENSLETAIRETKEESGLDIAAFIGSAQPIDEHEYYLPTPYRLLEARIPAYNSEPEHYHLDMQYIVRVPHQIAQHSEKESHDIKWFTLEEAEQLPTFEDIRLLLRQEMNK